MKKLLILVTLLIATVHVMAQKEKTPSIKKADSLFLVKAWKVNTDMSLNSVFTDTTLYRFQVYDPNEKSSISTSHLGNIGLASMPNVFFDKKDAHFDDFIFLRNYSNYLIESKDVIYYNTQKPVSNLYITSANKQKEEQAIDFTFTQNINPKLNVGTRFSLVGSKGQFPNQKAKNQSVAFFWSYIGDNYNLHTNFCFNKFKPSNNGGIIDTGNVIYDALESQLSKANSVLRDEQFYLAHEYKFTNDKVLKINDSTTKTIHVPVVSIGHIFHFKSDYHIYSDLAVSKLFYPDIFIDSTTTMDSSFFRTFSNSLQLRLFENPERILKFGASAGITYEMQKYYNFNRYVWSIPDMNEHSSIAFVNAYNSNSKLLRWTVNAKYYLEGYRSKDMQINAQIQKVFFTQTDSVSLLLGYQKSELTPGFFETSYHSNHFRWDNTFDKKQSTVYRFELEKKAWSLKLSANYGQFKNYIYFDSLALPQQYKNSFTVYSVQLNKDFHLRWFHILNKVVYQKISTDSVLQIPEIATYNAMYFSFNLFKKAIYMELGGEVYYSTAFKAYSYSPATAQFYLANQRIVGEHPIITGFINAKIKGTLIFVKFEHLNAFRKSKPVSYSANQYPANNFYFQFGVLWRFRN